MSAAAAPAAVTRNDCAQRAMLTVDLAAVAANTRFFASRTKAEVMAVVKADGFGHGCVPAARTALENGATWPPAPQRGHARCHGSRAPRPGAPAPGCRDGP